MFRNATKFTRFRRLEFKPFGMPSGHHGASRPLSNVGQSKRNGIGFALPFGFLVTGTVASAIFYAKRDPEFRKWLDNQIPGSSNFIKIVCQEDNLTASERVLDWLSDIQKWFVDLFSANESTPSKTEVAPLVKEEIIPYTAPQPAFASCVNEVSHPDSKSSDPSLKPRQEIRIFDSYEDMETTVSTDKPLKPSENSTLNEKPKKESERSDSKPAAPQKLINLEQEISKSAAVAVESYQRAINAIRDQARYVHALLLSDLSQLPPDLWPTIKEKSDTRDNLMTIADENAHIAEQKMLELEKLLLQGEFNTSKATLEQVWQNMKRMKSDIELACQRAEEELYSTDITKDFSPRVEEARQHWQQELKILFPDVNLKEKSLDILTDEIRQLVLYSFINVQYHQKELAQLEMRAEKKLREAIDKAISSGDSRDLVAAAVEEELRNERRQLDIQYQKKSLELRVSCEQEIRKQLRLQTEIQSDHLKDAVKLREVELEKIHSRDLSELLSVENVKYQLQVAALVGRLKGIDDGLKAHAQIDKSAQQAQDLWTACQIFYLKIDPHSKHTQLRPLSEEVKAIQKTVGESDELVNLVIQGVPKEALSRGVYPLKVLRERFLKVEKVARTVAAVPQGGSSLLMYLLSWVQGSLIWKGAQQITHAELENKPTAHELLNNYDLLSRARYWMDHGDLAQTLRYMNLLSGASRSIAEDWMNEVRIYLECQQAASVLVTHASAKGLIYS